LQGISERELAVSLGIPQKTLNNRKRKIFEKIRKKLPTEKISAKRKSPKNGLSKPFLRHHTLAGAEGLEPSARGFGATKVTV